jgi:hypothetical protein
MTDLRSTLGAQRLAGEVARHRHRWVHPTPAMMEVAAWRQWCASCGAYQDATATKKGRSSRNRGNRRELEIAKSLGGVKVGHHGGPEDVRAGIFVIQSKVRKAFPTWMWTELAKLPRTDGRIPLLIVTSPPGLDPHDRRKRLAIAVVSLDDWRDLHGEP